MKKILLFLSIITVAHFSNAQNVGIGTAEPYNKLQVAGNFMVSTPTITTSTPPTAAQTKTMVNNSTATFLAADSTGIIYDPGGPSGNYLPNLNSTTFITHNSESNGIELTAESLQLGAGDSLIVKLSATSPDISLAVGNGYTGTGRKWVFNISQLHIQFKSNADASVGIGFKLLFRRLYDNSASLPAVADVAGNGFFYDTKTSSLRAGEIAVKERGQLSVATGYRPIASGYASTAMGYFTNASEYVSTAMGYLTEASGEFSTAMGRYSIASGNSSIAIGDRANATNASAVALGLNLRASGVGSAAIGESCVASGTNAIAIGDDNDATGNSSAAFGHATRSSGLASTSLGYATQATASASTSMGFGTTARGYAGTVLGMFNHPIIGTAQTSAVPTTPLLIVGNGDNTSNLSNALSVLKNGNVGIGTLLPPSSRLQIMGGSDADLSDFSGYLVLGDVYGNNLVMDENEIIARNNGASTTLYLQNDGGSLVAGGSASKPGGGSWSATSDVRLKQHVQPYTDGLQQLQQINPVSFNYNQQSGYDTSKQFIGVVAQELQKVVPYMVGSFKKDGTDYLNVDNTAMTYMLINAVKEQQKEIDELKELIKKMIKNTAIK